MFWKMITFIVAGLGIVAALSLVNFPPPPPNLTVMYAPPPPNPYQQAVAASGLVEAFQDNIYLGVQVEGVVKEVYSKVNDNVQENQLLFEVDDRVQRAAVVVAKTSVQVAKGNLEKNISQLTRLTAIKDTRAVSLEDLRNK